jgi:hypothetical protein
VRSVAFGYPFNPRTAESEQDLNEKLQKNAPPTESAHDGRPFGNTANSPQAQNRKTEHKITQLAFSQVFVDRN